jgi:mRNA interferase RelE/StbE
VSFRISYTEEARRALHSMPGNYRQRARRLVENLANHPYPPGAKELRDLPGRFRLRLNGWRVIYKVDQETNSLLVLAIRRKIGPEAYQDLE